MELWRLSMLWFVYLEKREELTVSVCLNRFSVKWETWRIVWKKVRGHCSVSWKLILVFSSTLIKKMSKARIHDCFGDQRLTSSITLFPQKYYNMKLILKFLSIAPFLRLTCVTSSPQPLSSCPLCFRHMALVLPGMWMWPFIFTGICFLAISARDNIMLEIYRY